MDEIDVILPCLDEAAALPWVLSRMPDGFRPIVADNGSRDGSAEVARSYGARVVTVPERGFGAACHGGLLASETEVVCVMDADASLDPQELPAVAGPVIEGDADLVLGRRIPQGRGAWPRHARVANAVLARLLSGSLRKTGGGGSGRGGTGHGGGAGRDGARLYDLGPMRALRREPLLALELTDRGFGYPLEMVIRAAAAGWRVREVPVRYLPRVGRSKVTGTVRGTVRTARDMARVARGGPDYRDGPDRRTGEPDRRTGEAGSRTGEAGPRTGEPPGEGIR